MHARRLIYSYIRGLVRLETVAKVRSLSLNEVIFVVLSLLWFVLADYSIRSEASAVEALIINARVIARLVAARIVRVVRLGHVAAAVGDVVAPGLAFLPLFPVVQRRFGDEVGRRGEIFARCIVWAICWRWVGRGFVV